MIAADEGNAMERESVWKAVCDAVERAVERRRELCDGAEPGQGLSGNRAAGSVSHENQILRPCVISVDGMSGSGKSSLTERLRAIYDCNVFHMDDFFLQPWQRTGERLGAPGGNVDYERFKAEILDHLAEVEGLEYQVYSCRKQCLDEKVKVPFKEIQIVEGSYSQHPYFGDCYDLRIFLEIGSREQRERILKRNGEVMLERFVKEWIPMENRYFEAFKIREKAELVLTMGL